MPNPKEPIMISRLTASAALFAILATATLTFAAESQQHRVAARSVPMEVVQLPTVTIVGHRVH
jgi:hypothetical protein